MNRAALFAAALQSALDAESRKNSDERQDRPTGSRAYRCTHAGCNLAGYSKGLCNAHYIRNRKGFDMDAPMRVFRDGRPCIECDKPTGSKGGWFRCGRHFKVLRQRVLKAAAVACMGGRCAECAGEFPLPVFDFHHLGDKLGGPSVLIGNASIPRIAAELAKCVLLCANCHRMEHANEL
jgi:hypothetical protein